MKEFGTLARFREGETKKAPAAFVPPTKFAQGTILVFDQSVSATGWVVLASAKDLRVLAAGSFLLPAVDYPSGHEGTLRRGVVITQQAEEVLTRYHFFGISRVIHEAPPVGGRMARPESSLVAALAVRVAAERFGLPVSCVQNQHSKKVLTGSATVDKKDWHRALGRYSIDGKHKVTNEGQRDALCLGLTFLIDEEEQ